MKPLGINLREALWRVKEGVGTGRPHSSTAGLVQEERETLTPGCVDLS